MGRVNVVLGDGRVVSVEEETAKKAGLLGSVETPQQEYTRAKESANQSYYSSAKQEFLAALEGLGSTATLGATDLLGVTSGYGASQRAKYDPGARGIGEVIGAALPFAPGAAGAVGRMLPGGLAVKAGEGLAEATGAIKGTTRYLATQTAVEGALQSMGGEIAHAKLSGDPLTVEAIVTAAGRGALLGAGAGSVAGVVFRGVKMAKAAQEAEVSLKAGRIIRDNAKKALAETEEAWSGLKTEIKGLREQLAPAVKPKEFMGSLREASAQADTALRESGLRGATRGASPDVAEDRFTQARWQAAEKEALKRYSEFERAAAGGNTTKALEAHQAHIRAVNEATAIAGMPSNLPVAWGHDPFVGAAETLSALKKFPNTARDFAGMHPDTVAELINTLKASGPQGARALDMIGKIAESRGLKVEDTVKAATELQSHLSGLRSVERSSVATVAGQAKNGVIDTAVKGIRRRVGMKIGMGALGWTFGGPIGAAIAMEASGARSWMSDRVRNLIATAGTPVGRVIRTLGPVSDRLRERLFGGHDDETDKNKLVQNRIDEIHRAGYVARDLGFQTASPFAADHPEFALALANYLATGLEYLTSKAPLDPGTAMYLGKSEFQASDGQAEELATRLEVAQHPHEALERLLHGDADPVASEALWSMHPAMMQLLQQEVVMNIDKIREAGLPYAAVIGLSTALQVPLDSLMLPQNVSYFQNMSQMALQAGGVTSGPQPSRPAGRPPAVGTSNGTQLTRVQQLLQ